ncbi:MAG: hypothetical protein K0Q49_1772 [Haloplasmataceae bacterium]|jgi:hypothetical protein|nr:hypothetical protein [Haloplasmataceae bacterium]
MKAKISVPKLIEALKFLISCGIYFDGIDLDARTLDMSKAASLKISYPDNPVMLTGLSGYGYCSKRFVRQGES